ncbi:MAG TPA: SRPBCC family protein [Acidimicrobiales bacterium]
MELTNDFKVDAPVATVWEALTDVERIAPCLPGAELQSVEGDEYKGVVKVKVGPITAQYKGAARFAERDDANHRAVLEAEGRETRGQGNASATITAQLTPDGDSTTVQVVTDLKITGRVAQFGRGVLADVSAKLLDQFAGCLAEKLKGDGAGEAAAGAGEDEAGGGADAGAASGGGGAAGSSSSSSSGSTATAPAGTEPVDLLAAGGAPVAKRLIPIGIVITTAAWLLSLFIRRRRK